MMPEDREDWFEAIAFCFGCTLEEAKALWEGKRIADTPTPFSENSPKEKNQTVLRRNFDASLNGSQTTLPRGFFHA